MFKRVFAVLTVTALMAAFAAPTVMAHEGRVVGDYEFDVGFLNEPAYEGQLNGAYISVLGPADDGHSHDDHSHGEIDTETHGGLFTSESIEAGGSFSQVFGHDWMGIEIPYHDHLTGNGGTVMVMESAENSGTVMVTYSEDGFSPSELHVQPGTTVMFMNSTDGFVTVISGLHDGGDGHDHDGTDSGHVAVTGLGDTLKVEVTHVSSGVQREMELRPVFGQDGSYVADFVPTAPGVYSLRFFGEIDGTAVDETFTSGPNTFDEVQPAKVVQFPIELAEARELQDAVVGARSEATDAATTAEDADSQATLAMTIGILGLVVGVIGIGLGGYAVMGQSRKK